MKGHYKRGLVHYKLELEVPHIHPLPLSQELEEIHIHHFLWLAQRRMIQGLEEIHIPLLLQVVHKMVWALRKLARAYDRLA